MEPEEGLAEQVGEPAPARVAHEQSEAVRPAPAPPAAPAPAYTGGIFNLAAPAEQKSRNLDYLLEDDEPRRSKGLVLLVLIAVVLAFGLGYLRFRETGIPGFKASSKPAPPAAPSDTPPATPNAPDNTAAPTPPAANTPDQAPAASPSPNSAALSAPAAAAPSPATPAPATQAENNPSANTPAAAPAPAPAAPSSDSGNATAPAGQDASTPSAPAQAYVPKPVPAPQLEAPAPAATVVTPDDSPSPKPVKKTAAKPPAAKSEDSVALGEKYLYGRGVPQSCEKGLRYVKPAADQSNPKAMITMGALYATGHCLSRDLPTAYRYFALALRQDPANSALKQNTEMVWGQMTQSERQLAIRLTQ